MISANYVSTRIYKLCFLVGLDAAGKTTILYKLKLGEVVTTIPTIGKFACNFIERDYWFMCFFLVCFRETLRQKNNEYLLPDDSLHQEIF